MVVKIVFKAGILVFDFFLWGGGGGKGGGGGGGGGIRSAGRYAAYANKSLGSIVFE